jgi:hypothetical protein
MGVNRLDKARHVGAGVTHQEAFGRNRKLQPLECASFATRAAVSGTTSGAEGSLSESCSVGPRCVLAQLEENPIVLLI